jgi:two-component system cell cycle sensor histidine kinase/response regulator CckA
MLALVVDDDSAIRAYVRSILHSENYATIEAEGGEQGFETVERLSGAVELIISDIQMPTGDGVAFAKRVRRTYPFVPIILMSGYGQPEDDFDFVEKPFSWATMVRVVRRATARRARVA